VQEVQETVTHPTDIEEGGSYGSNTVMAYIYTMEVNKKVAGEYQKVGEVQVPIFGLEEFGLEVEATGKGEDGLPTYATDSLNFVFGALFAACKADARNKLQPGTATLKVGQKIASSVAELIEKAERAGAASAIAREFNKAFSAYLASSSGKSTAVQAVLAGMTKNRATIALSSEVRRNALLAQLAGFADTLSVEDTAKYQNTILAISEACTGAVELDDSDF